jgi:hypothetical protein
LSVNNDVFITYANRVPKPYYKLSCDLQNFANSHEALLLSAIF